MTTVHMFATSGHLMSVFGKFDLAKDFLLFIAIQLIGNHYAELAGMENLGAGHIW